MGQVFNLGLKRYTSADFFAIPQKEWPSVVCFVLKVHARKPTQCFVLYVSVKKPTYFQLLTHFAEVIECLLMFLLNVLVDFTDELDVFCQSFATPNTSASLYSILTYQIKFPLPQPGY